MPHVRSVSVGIWICTGARSESPEQLGLAHFLEHMVFQGTKERSAEDIARSVDSIGGNLDAFTGKELACYNAKVLDEHLPQVFDVLSDLVLHPLFADSAIRKEKGVVLEELKMENDNPDYLVHELFYSNLWKGHPLGNSILGTRRTIRRFNADMLRDYFSNAYVAGNILITAAGNLRHERMLELIKAKFEHLPRKKAPRLGDPPSPRAATVLKHKPALEQVHLCIGVPAIQVNHKRRYACFLLNTVLGGGMSSRLFQNIREKRGLAYSIFSEMSQHQDSGSLSVSAGTSREATRKVVQLVSEEFKRLKDEPIEEDVLRRAKDQLKGSLMLSLESTSNRMANLARQELYFRRFFELDEIISGVENVTSPQIQQLAAEFFQTDKIALTVLGNLKGIRLKRSDLAC